MQTVLPAFALLWLLVRHGLRHTGAVKTGRSPLATRAILLLTSAATGAGFLAVFLMAGAVSSRGDTNNAASPGPEWFPQITTAEVKNFVPNSSFECGTANWGGFTYGLTGGGDNLFRLEAVLDSAKSQHGGHSLKISLSPKTAPVRYSDYFEPRREPVRRALAANEGWFKVSPGEPLTLSAYLRADAPGVAGQLIVNEAPGRLLHHAVAVGTNWERFQFTFTPSGGFLFIGAGLDLEESKRDAATLWLDAVQLERGEHTTEYTPRTPIESFLETGVEGNIFTNLDRAASLTVRTYNNTSTQKRLESKLELRDFFDHPPVVLDRPIFARPNGETVVTFGRLNQGRLGFFRADWKTPGGVQSLRCAVIQPAAAGATNSPFGFNHAFPWQFLVGLAREAGIVWWRDWSAQWRIIEPEPGRFDFRRADEQIERVLGLDGQVEVLLPFPSAPWSTTARADEVARSAGNDAYLRTRLRLAYAPANVADFGRYAAGVVRHYAAAAPQPASTPGIAQRTAGASPPRRATTFQVLNEPVYTDYSLPEKFGYKLEDYLRLLEAASKAMKAAAPGCRVVGGISANLRSDLTRAFIAKGGLKFVDVFDLHIYDRPRPIEEDEAAFDALNQLSRKHGGPKPFWITEWGCYAEDDPSTLPLTAGDPSMDKCLWPDERAASEHIVKFAATAFAAGARKIFFHQGSCGSVNNADAGGVLFEYGGAPRKMYPTIAAFTSLVGVPDEFLKRIRDHSLTACLFRVGENTVAVVWQAAGPPRKLVLAQRVAAYDLMGNEISRTTAELGASPLYLVGRTAQGVEDSLRPPTVAKPDTAKHKTTATPAPKK